MPNSEVVIQTVQLSIISDVLAIILSIVALIVTVIGFFASLKFYRDGVELQKAANDALTKVEEKMSGLQSHIVSMFDKTLDAAISPSSEVNKSFDDLDEFLEKVKSDVLKVAKEELGEKENKNASELKEVLNSQLSALEEKINQTREIAESSNVIVHPSKCSEDDVTSEQIFSLLREAGKPLTLMQAHKILGGTGRQRMSLKKKLHALIDAGLLSKRYQDNGETPVMYYLPEDSAT
ncbi:hypothetical protein [Vreelandella sp. EE7]